MYAITHNNQVFLTPTSWKPRYIASVIEQDYDVKVVLTSSDEHRVPFDITPEIRILRTEESRPEINSLIETYDGPFWTIQPTKAIATYTKRQLPIDMIKDELKKTLASKRYDKECTPIKMTVNDTEVSVETDRYTRNIFMQAVLFMRDDEVRKWKFPEGWIDLSKQELLNIVYTAAAKIQSDFDWEESLAKQIDAASTPQELLDINGIING